MNIYIGIDPSINSTGICIQYFDENNNFLKEHYYIIKSSKLTKRETKAMESLLNFDYLIYDKTDLKIYEKDNHKHEFYKTQNLINCINTIKELLQQIIRANETADIYVVMEGISYGSVMRTKSVFDLAGLNYMIRMMLYKLKIADNITIATPSEIKKFATGNGNCAKNIMIAAFEASHDDVNIIPKIDDIADAYFMSLYAKHIYTVES